MKNAMKLPIIRNFIHRFARHRRATASVEFALNGMVLLLFIFGIINLGDLGLTVGTMKRAVQQTVRTAAVQTGAAIAQTGNPSDCATSAQIITAFNSIASPILPAAAATANNGAPIVQTAWSNATTTNPAPGTELTVTASFTWTPLGMGQNFGAGLPLTISSTQLVLGTSGATTSCS
jgi:Flp pilus assembly protein TadG